MPLACSVCHRDKWKSDFSRRARDKKERVCKDCRDVRDKDKRERRQQANRDGKRICSVCNEAKERSSFGSGRECRCKECKAKMLRLAREVEPLRPGSGKRGTPEAGFTCSTCETLKPAEEFPLRAGGNQDYRCKQCMASRTERYRCTDHGLFVNARGIASRRRIEWAISEEEYTAFRRLLCHYCGHSLPGSGVALDRKDCEIGYIVSNVVPCCFECNIAKGSIFTYAEFLLIGKVIAQVKAERLRIDDRFSTANGWGRPRKYQVVP